MWSVSLISIWKNFFDNFRVQRSLSKHEGHENASRAVQRSAGVEETSFVSNVLPVLRHVGHLHQRRGQAREQPTPERGQGPVDALPWMSKVFPGFDNSRETFRLLQRAEQDNDGRFRYLRILFWTIFENRPVHSTCKRTACAGSCWARLEEMQKVQEVHPSHVGY